jgi:hypothetical protein
MRFATGCGVALLAGLAGLALPLPAAAQAPPYPPPPPQGAAPPASPEAAEIARCLCLRQDMDALGADTAAKRVAYDRVRGELDRIDAELQQERATTDVNNPEAVARFRQKLAQRDALFQRSTGPVAGDLTGATTRYNDNVNEYNARCANRPRNPDLLAQVQATLTCPAR